MVEDEAEITQLAEKCLALGRRACAERIDRRVARALAGGMWDDMHKWQRVKLRVMRLQRVEDAVAGRAEPILQA